MSRDFLRTIPGTKYIHKFLNSKESQNTIHWYLIMKVLPILLSIIIVVSLDKTNSAYQKMQLKGLYVQHLLQDLEQDRSALEQLEIQNKTYETAGWNTLRFIESENTFPENENHAKRDLVLAQYLSLFTANNSTYQDLLHTGNGSLFDDFESKKLLDQYYALDLNKIDFYKRIQKTIWYDLKDKTLEYMDPLILHSVYKNGSYGSFTLTDDASDDYNLTSYDVDWTGIKNDPDLLIYLKHSISHRVQVLNDIKNFQLKLEKLQNHLEQIN